MRKDCIITHVHETEDSFVISYDDQTVNSIYKKYNVVPKVGDHAEIYTINSEFGRIYSIIIDGTIVFNKSDSDMEAERSAFIQQIKDERIKTFNENKELMDKKYDNLPKCFQERIDKFRNSDPNFRLESESYEVFVYEQAIHIANALKTIPDIEHFKNNMSWTEQRLIVPNLDDGHSGNTFNAACMFAGWYLNQIKTLRFDNSDDIF